MINLTDDEICQVGGGMNIAGDRESDNVEDRRFQRDQNGNGIPNTGTPDGP